MGLYDGIGYDGRGAYSSNSLMAGSSRAPPQFGSVADETGALIVSHREYVSDIFGPDPTRRDFMNRTYELNPGVERTFPWLSQLAQNYEEYELGQLVFEYKSTVDASVAGDGQVGTIVMVTNYNSASRQFEDKNSMMQYDGSNSCRTTSHAVHGVECDPAKLSGAAGHYIRVKPKVGQDLKTYDHGLFQLATVGMPENFDNATIGELWVTYTVKLRKPRLFSGKGLNLSRDMYLANIVDGSNRPSDGLRLAIADTNNIGTRLSKAPGIAATTNGRYYDLLFPASFSGSVEIRLTICGNLKQALDSADSTHLTGENSVFGENAAYFDGESAATGDVSKRVIERHPLKTGETDTAGNEIVLPPGNISEINDIFGAYPGSDVDLQSRGGRAPRWTTSAREAMTSGGTGDTVDQDRLIAIAHLRIGIATSGRDNIFRIWIPDVKADSNAQYCLDISEYNTFDLPLSKAYPSFSKIDSSGAVTTAQDVYLET